MFNVIGLAGLFLAPHHAALAPPPAPVAVVAPAPAAVVAPKPSAAPAVTTTTTTDPAPSSTIPPGFLQQEAAGTEQPTTDPGSYGTVVGPGITFECVVVVPDGPTFSPGPADNGDCSRFYSLYPSPDTVTVRPETDPLASAYGSGS